MNASHNGLAWLAGSGVSSTASDHCRPCEVKQAAAHAEVLDAYSRAVIAVSEALSPAVVGISIGMTSQRGTEEYGSGSGFIIAPDGYLLTNSHVVSGAEAIEVVLLQGDRLRAELIGLDPSSDLAVIHVDANDLPYALLSENRDLKVGQLVVAMGNPFGFQSTVSTGVISALGRSLRSQQGRLIENVVQHTAPLNPGSSGGPLLDSRGHAIGINTAIIAMAQGIGFAIPASTARWVVTQLITRGRVRRSYLGIVGQTRQLGRRIVRYHGLQAERGVEIVSLDPGGPAAASGVVTGEILVAINDHEVQTVDDILHHLSDWPVGKELTLTLIRGSERRAVAVVTQEAP